MVSNSYPQQALCFELSVANTMALTSSAIEDALGQKLPQNTQLLQWAIVASTATHWQIEGYCLTL